MSRYTGSSMKVLVVVAAFGSFSAFADSILVENVEITKGAEAFEGFSIGLDALYSHVSVDRSAFEMQVGDKASGRIDGKWSHSRCRIDPSLNLGYSRIVNNWYMGVAADVSFGSNKKKAFEVKQGENALPFVSTIKGTSYGVKAKGGYYCPKLKTVIYGFAGVKWKEIDFRINSDNETVTKAKLSSPAVLVGAGVERKLCKKVTMSAEYEFAWRNSDNVSSAKFGDVNIFANADQKLRDHTVKIGIKYHF